MGLIGHGWDDEDWGEPVRDWITNPWGWPTQFGLGDERAKHPVDPDYPMIYAVYSPRGATFWDERLQMEYSI